MSDIAEGRTEAGKLYVCVAIDHTCKLASAELPPQALKTVAAPCLRHRIAAIPYKRHTILMGHGIQCPPVTKIHLPFTMSLGVYARSRALSLAAPTQIITGPTAKLSP